MKTDKGKSYKKKLKQKNEISERKQAEEMILLNNQRMESLVKILQYDSENVQQFLDYALAEAIKLTGSKIGYIYYYSEEKEEFTLNTWSKDVMRECTVANPQTCYQLANTGMWGEAVRQRKPIVLNDFQASNPLKKGYPEGHAPLFKYLTVPVFSEGKIIAVVAVANKETDYDQTDILELTILMDSIWKEVDRKHAEEALRESEERFSKAYKTSPISFMIANMEDGRIIEVNDAFTSISGFTREEALASSTLDLNIWVHKEDRLNMIAALRDGRAVVRKETMLRAKNGNISTVLLSAQLIQLGQKYCIISSIEDMTERKKMEETLRESEMRTQQIINNAPFGAHYYKLEEGGRLIFKGANPAADTILGVNHLQFVGRTIEEAFPPLARTVIPDMYRQAAATGIRYDSEQVDYEYGSIRGAYEVHAFQTSLNNISAFFIDITDRKRAEEALRESEKKYRQIFENVQDLYYETAVDGTIIEVSPSIKILSKGQYKREDLIGRSMYEFYSDPGERQSLLLELKEQGSVADFEITLKNRDGSLITCSTSARISLDTLGHPEKIIGSMRDITERKKAEEELISAKEKAEESDRLKTAFLRNISHEIRTPMNAIVGFSALLGEPDVASSVQNSYIDVIMKSSNHLLSIITDIIDISNIEANIVRVNKNEIILNSLLHSLNDQFLPKAREKGIDLVIESELTDEDSRILADNTKLIQIISNLLSNAIKFTHKGQIRFGYSVKDKLIEFFVTDTGIGIHGEHHTRIFDRFFQIENPASRLYEGTGLGLAICKAYVELLGGEISLSSTPGAGSTFYFTIPYEKLPGMPKPVPLEEKENGFVFSEKKRILVAEDIDSNFKLIEYFLAGANTDIIRAWNGKEAVDKVAADKKIDLVLMDLKMPVMDGYAAAKLIRESRPDIPVIVQTAYADDKTKVMECGCNGFISKPFDKHKLLQIIRKFI
jgi:PAS domain S-box-containing protein